MEEFGKVQIITLKRSPHFSKALSTEEHTGSHQSCFPLLKFWKNMDGYHTFYTGQLSKENKTKTKRNKANPFNQNIICFVLFNRIQLTKKFIRVYFYFKTRGVHLYSKQSVSECFRLGNNLETNFTNIFILKEIILLVFLLYI